MNNVDLSTQRFSGAEWFEKAQKTNVIIVGAGGIGSWLSLALARIGYNLQVYDFDIYDEQNLAGQFVSVNHIEHFKTSALQISLQKYCKFSDSKNSFFSTRFEERFITADKEYILVSAVDSIDVRKELFEIYKNNENVKFFVDGRMSAEMFETFCIYNDKSEEAYNKYLFPKDQANELPCSFKATTHNAMGIAYIMTGIINNLLVRENIWRNIPFRTNFQIDTFFMEIYDEEDNIINII